MDFLKYKRIIIIGSAGSGKSWLAKRIADITGYKLIHLDCEYWQLNWTITPKEEWVEKQKGFIQGEEWIIDGNYDSSLELRFTAADLAIFLDINRIACMWSVFKRHGKKRSDLPDYLEEKLNLEFVGFLKWIWTFKKTGGKKILDLHEKYPEKEFMVFKRRSEVNEVIRLWSENAKTGSWIS